MGGVQFAGYLLLLIENTLQHVIPLFVETKNSSIEIEVLENLIVQSRERLKG